jgi:hypothetical protein
MALPDVIPVEPGAEGSIAEVAREDWRGGAAAPCTKGQRAATSRSP